MLAKLFCEITHQSKYVVCTRISVQISVFNSLSVQNSHEIYLQHGGVVLCSVQWRQCISCIMGLRKYGLLHCFRWQRFSISLLYTDL